MFNYNVHIITTSRLSLDPCLTTPRALIITEHIPSHTPGVQCPYHAAMLTAQPIVSALALISLIRGRAARQTPEH